MHTLSLLRDIQTLIWYAILHVCININVFKDSRTRKAAAAWKNLDPVWKIQHENHIAALLGKNPLQIFYSKARVHLKPSLLVNMLTSNHMIGVLRSFHRGVTTFVLVFSETDRKTVSERTTSAVSCWCGAVQSCASVKWSKSRLRYN